MNVKVAVISSALYRAYRAYRATIRVVLRVPLLALVVSTASAAETAAVGQRPGDATAADTELSAGRDERDFVWENGLRRTYFQDRPILRGDEVVSLDAPSTAADPALVPIAVSAAFEQTPQRHVKTITLLIDNNPAPLVGRFHFTQHSGRADLKLRVRVNAYSAVRAIAELDDGSLHMSQRFVRASGGCAAPPAADLEAALTRLGKMKLKVRGLAPAASPLPTQLRISHPNLTGLQLDQVNRAYTPAHFVQSIEVSFDGQPVLTAETDISVSADPALGFYFAPSRPGELVARFTDNRGNSFIQRYRVGGRADN